MLYTLYTDKTKKKTKLQSPLTVLADHGALTSNPLL